MSVKNVCLATLVTALLGVGVVRGQYTPPAPEAGPNMATGPAGVSGPAPTGRGEIGQSGQPGGGPILTPPAGSICLSKWILGTEPGCCGPVGSHGPIYMETYIQSGISFPFSDGVFGHTLEPGWVIQGGGRSLFFNADQDAAWVIDLSISNVNNQGRNPSYEVPLTHILVPTPGTTGTTGITGATGTTGTTGTTIPGLTGTTTPTPAHRTAPGIAFQQTPTTPTIPTTVPTTAATTPTTFAVVNFVPLAQLHRIQAQQGVAQSRRPVQLLPARNGHPQFIAAEGVSIEELNRTYVNLGVGRDWYLWGQAPTYLNCGQRECGQLAWRFGIDGGGRYGTAKLSLHEIQHRKDAIAGIYAAAHTDVEYPCGCCTFQAGIRVEYDYTWMDILQEQNDADVQEINLLFTAGVRF
jgi:hypothetical protein